MIKESRGQSWFRAIVDIALGVLVLLADLALLITRPDDLSTHGVYTQLAVLTLCVLVGFRALNDGFERIRTLRYEPFEPPTGTADEE